MAACIPIKITSSQKFHWITSDTLSIPRLPIFSIPTPKFQSGFTYSVYLAAVTQWMFGKGSERLHFSFRCYCVVTSALAWRFFSVKVANLTFLGLTLPYPPKKERPTDRGARSVCKSLVLLVFAKTHCTDKEADAEEAVLQTTWPSCFEKCTFSLVARIGLQRVVPLSLPRLWLRCFYYDSKISRS